MIIQPKTRGFICVTAHPGGCAKNVLNQIDYVKSEGEFKSNGATLVIGCSTGYGLASLVTAAFGAKDDTIGVFFDKPPQGNRTGTAGWYNMAAFAREAENAGRNVSLIMGDAFSHAVKGTVLDEIKRSGKKIGRVIYSIASPVRIDPDTGQRYASCIKPIDETYKSKSIDLSDYSVYTAEIAPADGREIHETVKVMGGDDWKLWMDLLKGESVLSEDCVTLAYSYIGPEMTHPIYTNGTIGRAKADLKRTAEKLSGYCKAYISVNKALVTQASSAIPVVPLYISILFKVMKKHNLHEDCIEQMARMFKKIEAGNFLDEDSMIRMDDYEMRGNIQSEVMRAWETVDDGNLREFADIEGYKRSFLQLFGFDVEGIDYEKDIDNVVEIPGLITIG